MDLLSLPKAAWDAIDKRIDAAIARAILKLKRELADEAAEIALARRNEIDMQLKGGG